jgi:HD-GYP domain-containing protein (c-di-GMP phosphodiesterase class II)
VEPLLGPEVAEIVLRHHEQYDGKGYPSRIVGARIPIGARIGAITDVWAAITHPWTYAVAVTETEAIARLREGAGTQFDPVLVESFVSSLSAIV